MRGRIQLPDWKKIPLHHINTQAFHPIHVCDWSLKGGGSLGLVIHPHDTVIQNLA
jgi:hypothetical protein